MQGTPVPLFIARHGETVDNANHLILGRRDPPLSDRGREQSAQLASRAGGLGVVAIWCSPLLRARQTAAVAADAIGVAPTILDDLIESARGSWEGNRSPTWRGPSPRSMPRSRPVDKDFAFPGGESLLDQVKRTRKALDLVTSGAAPALVVAHAGTIRAALIAVGRAVPPERELPHGEALPLTWVAGQR